MKTHTLSAILLALAICGSPTLALGENPPPLDALANRIRPETTTSTAPAIELPAANDRPGLMPDGHIEIARLNCGSETETISGNLAIRRKSGRSIRFANHPHPLATADAGGGIVYEIRGLDAAADYVLGISAWDADSKGRRQRLRVNDHALLPEFTPVGYHAGKPTYVRIHLPLPRDLTAGGDLTLAIDSLEEHANAVVGELWLLRRNAPQAAATKRVVILTGDDYPGHLWRLTGPEFATILRADPRLEVTISESPALLGSPALAAYDVVFIHFKNYHERLPTTRAMWRNLEAFVDRGGGLVIAHFGCGAMQEWNGFVRLAGRVWDPQLPGHDPYGEFLVRVLQTGHPATAGLEDFTTTDELYTCLGGDTPIEVLAEATSRVDAKCHPMAFVLTPGKGRVFHSPLGHDLPSLQPQGTRRLYLQGTLWAAGILQ